MKNFNLFNRSNAQKNTSCATYIVSAPLSPTDEIVFLVCFLPGTPPK